MSLPSITSQNRLKIKNDSTFVNIANTYGFTVSYTGTYEANTPMSTCFVQNIKTSNGMDISFDMGLDENDEGQLLLLGTVFAKGAEAEKEFEWTDADNAVRTFKATVEISGRGGATDSVDKASIVLHVNDEPEKQS